MKKLFISILLFFLIIPIFAADVNIFCSNKYSNHKKHYHEHYSLCYSTDIYCPEYVVWTLTELEALAAEEASNRSDDFTTCGESATKKDYANSGYDKGHLCPSNDFDYTKEDSADTFRMCNMTPQTHAMNAGKWASLETFTHTLAKRYGHIDIIAGPVYINSTKLIAGKIRVPDGFFRIFYNKEAKFIECYLVSQENEQRTVSVEEIEELTGLKFEFL